MLQESLERLDGLAKESIDNGAPVQIPEAIGVGDMLPQGDIGLLVLEKLPEDVKPIECNGDMQLAPGTNKGSRHVIPAEFAQNITFFRVEDGDPLSDMCLEAKESFNLTHPEHADHLGYPPGIYRVLHQQNEQRQRVLD